MTPANKTRNTSAWKAEQMKEAKGKVEVEVEVEESLIEVEESPLVVGIVRVDSKEHRRIGRMDSFESKKRRR